jgi:hypothetical protein
VTLAHGAGLHLLAFEYEDQTPFEKMRIPAFSGLRLSIEGPGEGEQNLPVSRRWSNCMHLTI